MSKELFLSKASSLASRFDNEDEIIEEAIALSEDEDKTI